MLKGSISVSHGRATWIPQNKCPGHSLNRFLMIRWWEHFIDWALKFYWMSSICLTLFLVSPNPQRTTVSSSCWWGTRITQRMRQQSLQTVMMGTFGRWLASDQPDLERNRPLERDTSSISALACDSAAKYSSGNHSLFLYLASPEPLHEGKENSSMSPWFGT